LHGFSGSIRLGLAAISVPVTDNTIDGFDQNVELLIGTLVHFPDFFNHLVLNRLQLLDGCEYCSTYYDKIADSGVLLIDLRGVLGLRANGRLDCVSDFGEPPSGVIGLILAPCWESK
jgi:hypothetical protein